MGRNLLDLHTHLRQSKPQATNSATIAIYNLTSQELSAGSYDNNICFSAGIHPWYLLPTTMDVQLAMIKEFSRNTRVKLIGECGLDKLKGPKLDIQAAALVKQISMANEVGKPLLIHCVRAYDELIKIRKTVDITVPAVIHGFNKSPELAADLIRHGFLLSFGEALLKENSQAARSFVQTFKNGDPVFLETDGSACSIEDIYLQASYLLKVSTEQLKDAIFASWKSIGIYHD